MLTIVHIYNEKLEKIESLYVTTLQDFKNNPKKFYPDWKMGYYATDIEIKYPKISIDGTLEEKTREELVEDGIEVSLNEGEMIVGNKIIKKEKPNTGLTNSWKWSEEKKEYVYDISEARQKFFNEVDKLKSESLNYGFEYEIDGTMHRQRCRDKDITFLTSVNLELLAEFMTGNKNATSLWFFEDNYKYEFNLLTLKEFSKAGKMFVDSVYLTENYYKTKVEPKEISREEFEQKRKEIYATL